MTAVLCAANLFRGLQSLRKLALEPPETLVEANLHGRLNGRLLCAGLQQKRKFPAGGRARRPWYAQPAAQLPDFCFVAHFTSRVGFVCTFFCARARAFRRCVIIEFKLLFSERYYHASCAASQLRRRLTFLLVSASRPIDWSPASWSGVIEPPDPAMAASPAALRWIGALAVNCRRQVVYAVQ